MGRKEHRVRPRRRRRGCQGDASKSKPGRRDAWRATAAKLSSASFVVIVTRCMNTSRNLARVRTECRARVVLSGVFSRELRRSWGRDPSHIKRRPSRRKMQHLAPFVERPYCRTFSPPYGCAVCIFCKFERSLKHPLGVRGSSGTRHLSVCNIPGDARRPRATGMGAPRAPRAMSWWALRVGALGVVASDFRGARVSLVPRRVPLDPLGSLLRRRRPGGRAVHHDPHRGSGRARPERHVHSDDCPWRRAPVARWFRRQLHRARPRRSTVAQLRRMVFARRVPRRHPPVDPDGQLRAPAPRGGGRRPRHRLHDRRAFRAERHLRDTNPERSLPRRRRRRLRGGRRVRRDAHRRRVSRRHPARAARRDPDSNPREKDTDANLHHPAVDDGSDDATNELEDFVVGVEDSWGYRRTI